MQKRITAYGDVCVCECVSQQAPYTDLPPHELEPDLCVQSMMPIQAGMCYKHTVMHARDT